MNAINSNEQMIQKINEVLQNKKDAIVNIVNDKLTISVFSLLEKNLQNVKEINLYCSMLMILQRRTSYSIFPKLEVCTILLRSMSIFVRLMQVST